MQYNNIINILHYIYITSIALKSLGDPKVRQRTKRKKVKQFVIDNLFRFDWFTGELLGMSEFKQVSF